MNNKNYYCTDKIIAPKQSLKLKEFQIFDKRKIFNLLVLSKIYLFVYRHLRNIKLKYFIHLFKLADIHAKN